MKKLLKLLFPSLWQTRFNGNRITPEKIIELVGMYHNFPDDWHKNKSRYPELALRRFESMYIIKKKIFHISKENIPDYFGLKRSTFYHAEKTINNMLDTNRGYKREFDKMLKFIERYELINNI